MRQYKPILITLQRRCHYSNLKSRKERPRYAGDMPKGSQLSSEEPGLKPGSKLCRKKAYPHDLHKQGFQNPIRGLALLRNVGVVAQVEECLTLKPWVQMQYQPPKKNK